MDKIQLTHLGGYHFRSSPALTPDQARQCLALLEAEVPVPDEDGPLGGRRRPASGFIQGLGEVVLKPYVRGGFIGRCIRTTHFRTGAPRSQREYDGLSRVREFGISAPKPLASVWRGGIFYACWLMMEKIPDTETLAGLSLSDPGRTAAVLGKVRDQVSLLVENRVLHVDLHPGNVLVDPKNQVFFIDFDKARFNVGNPLDLLDRYTRRWRRAVIKHGLPDLLHSVFD